MICRFYILEECYYHYIYIVTYMIKHYYLNAWGLKKVKALFVKGWAFIVPKSKTSIS